jgi:hypothetical protein
MEEMGKRMAAVDAMWAQQPANPRYVYNSLL